MSALARWLPLAGLVAAVATLALVPLAPTTTAAAPGRAVELARFGGSHFGGRGLFSSRPSLGRGVPRLRTASRGRGILRSIGRALAFAAIFHFLFAGSSGLGFVLLLVLVFLAFRLMRRRRRAYAPRW